MPLFWRLLYHLVRTLAESDEDLWVEIRRGLMGVVKAPTAQDARAGLHRIAAAIARRYPPS